MPWVGKVRDDENHQTFLDCEACAGAPGKPGTYPPEIRARMGCGLMRPAERTGSFVHGGLPMTGEDAQGNVCPNDICPGWLISLPRVQEATRAYSWAKKGMLSEFFEGQHLPRVLFDAIDTFGIEVEHVKAAMYEEAGKATG